MLISFVGFIIYRELKPYHDTSNTLLATTAQCVLFIVFFVTLLSSTDTIETLGMNDLELGSVLLLLTLSVAALALGLGAVHYQEKQKRRRQWVRCPVAPETCRSAPPPQALLCSSFASHKPTDGRALCVVRWQSQPAP